MLNDKSRAKAACLVGNILMWLSCWALCHPLCCRTWTKGNNEDFLGRVAKYGQRHKWAALMKAFHAAAYKVRVLSAVSPASLYSCTAETGSNTSTSCCD